MKELRIAALTAAGLLTVAAMPALAQGQHGVEVGNNIAYITQLAKAGTYKRELTSSSGIQEFTLNIWQGGQPLGEHAQGLETSVLGMKAAINLCDEAWLATNKLAALKALAPIAATSPHPALEIARFVMAVSMRCGNRVRTGNFADVEREYRYMRSAVAQDRRRPVPQETSPQEDILAEIDEMNRAEEQQQKKQAKSDKGAGSKSKPLGSAGGKTRIKKVDKAGGGKTIAKGDVNKDPGAPARICSSYGAGFFYIPGTDTCLRIGGFLQYSRIGNPSDLGGGTVVRGGKEGFLFGLPSSIDRWGGEFDFETPSWEEIFGLEPGDLSPGAAWLASTFFYGHIAGAWGSEDSSGTAEIGVDDVTGLGFTFADENPTFGTGFIASTPGFALEGSGSIDNSWVLGGFGVGHAIPLGGTGPSGPSLVLKTGLYAEGLDFDASGSTRLTFGGMPFENFHQDFDYDSSDHYYGLELGAEVKWDLSPKARLSLGASLYPAYHSGKGDYSLETGSFSASPETVEDYSYDDSGFTLGAGISAGLDFSLTPNLSIGTGAKISWLPEVTAFDAAASPAGQPAHFHKETVERVFVDILKIRARF